METFKNQLIYVDREAFERERIQCQEAAESLSAAVKAFNDLGVCVITPNLYKAAITANFEALENSLSDGIKHQLKAAKISVNAISDAAVEKCLYNFRESVQPLFENARYGYLAQLPYITFERDSVAFADKSEKILRERFSVWVTSETALRAYETHKKLVNIVNEFKQITAMNDWDFMRTFFTNFCKWDGLVFDAPPLNYDVIGK